MRSHARSDAPPPPSPLRPAPAALLLAAASLAGCATAGRAPSPCPGAGAPAPPRWPSSPPGTPPAQVAFDAERVEVSGSTSSWPARTTRSSSPSARPPSPPASSSGPPRPSAGWPTSTPARATRRPPSSTPAWRYPAGAVDGWRCERFDALARRYEGPDALEAAFKVAECHYHHDELRGGRRRPEALAARAAAAGRAGPRPRPARRRRAGARPARRRPRRSLRLAVSTWRQAEATGAARRPRRRPGAVPPRRGLPGPLPGGAARPVGGRRGEAGSQDLEDKASLLLSAQGHYLRTIRMSERRTGRWRPATASASSTTTSTPRCWRRPPPPGLDAEEADAYRLELRQRVRVLVAKAIAIYEQTLAVAGRARVEDNRFVARAQASLDRMKQALLRRCRPTRARSRERRGDGVPRRRRWRGAAPGEAACEAGARRPRKLSAGTWRRARPGSAAR